MQAGSLHLPPSGIHVPLCINNLCLEGREVTVLALESETASEVKMEDLWRFFRLCKWINRPFKHLRVLAEGTIEVAATASEAEDRCFPRGAVVDGEFRSGGVHSYRRIILVCQSGAMRSYDFACLPELRKRHILLFVEAYSIGGSALY